ncbi:hypothetical protein M5689_017945 [Euphorbia peplus]|nr:hypothetical protein M5689_017945 [Euphorbia peplus]
MSSSGQANMKAKLESYARKNNLPPPKIETIGIKNQSKFISRVSIKGKIYIGSKCDAKEEAEASAASLALTCVGATALPPEEMSRQFQELKVMYEDLIRYSESMLEQSKTCLCLIQMNSFVQFESTCEDLVHAIENHKENLIRDLRFVEAKIIARTRACDAL